MDRVSGCNKHNLPLLFMYEWTFWKNVSGEDKPVRLSTDAVSSNP